MITLIRIIAWLSLVVLILPSILYLSGAMDLPAMKSWMLWTSLVWFFLSGGLAYFNSNETADA